LYRGFLSPLQRVDTNKMAQTSKLRFVLDIILRILGVAAAIGLILNGVYCFNSTGCPNASIRDYIVSIVLIVFSFLLGLAEISHFFKRFASLNRLIHNFIYFLAYRSGRGVAFIVLGALGLTQLWWHIVTAIAAVVVGVINIAAAICRCCGGKNESGEEGLAKQDTVYDSHDMEVRGSREDNIDFSSHSSNHDL